MKIDRLKAEKINDLTSFERNFEALNDAGEVVADYDDVVTKKLRIRKIFEEDGQESDIGFFDDGSGISFERVMSEIGGN